VAAASVAGESVAEAVAIDPKPAIYMMRNRNTITPCTPKTELTSCY
jgi:hypothetical protein